MTAWDIYIDEPQHTQLPDHQNSLAAAERRKNTQLSMKPHDHRHTNFTAKNTASVARTIVLRRFPGRLRQRLKVSEQRRPLLPSASPPSYLPIFYTLNNSLPFTPVAKLPVRSFPLPPMADDSCTSILLRPFAAHLTVPAVTPSRCPCSPSLSALFSSADQIQGD